MNTDTFDDPEGTREEILAATYRALDKYGYSDLTIQRIGDEFDKSTSLLYYHYENKDELVIETLEYLLDAFETEFTESDVTDPRERLEEFLAQTFATLTESTRPRTLLELRARAAHDERYRRHFERSDQVFKDYLSELLNAGVESGTFRDLDPQAVSTTILLFLDGALLRCAVNPNEAWKNQAQTEIETYLKTRVYGQSVTRN
ncbi:TetR/AcrR family transcriptional regulator [Halobellus rufus]|uniref:TetR/AcrR family transcriptional regulator n=1 Tax=Halobellus rufus TaxID=1448860 RepID=UPI000679BF98|nr:TetR/AcrR family transcriptional regulator [Halobellus rufus]